MTKCNACHAELDVESSFCTRCGGPVDPAVSMTEPDVRHVACGLCGRQVEEGMTYCNHCGAELTVVGSLAKTAVPQSPTAEAVVRSPDNGEERELFRKGNVSYMNMKDLAVAGIMSSLGTLVITTRRIVFEPSMLNLSTITSFFSGKPANRSLEIGMDEVTDASVTTVFAMNIGLAVTTTAKKYTFSLGLGGGGDLEKAVRLINEYKTGYAGSC